VTQVVVATALQVAVGGTPHWPRRGNQLTVVPTDVADVVVAAVA
jgi:hypothetical protein